MSSRTDTVESTGDDDARPKSRRLLISIVAVVVVLAVAGWWFLWPDPPRPATLRAEPTSAFYAAIDSRQNDAAPLTLQEVFTPATQNLGGMTLAGSQAYTDCDEVLWGVSAAGCTQALRASYKGGAMAGQFVIFNLGDGRAADALVSALGKDGFVRQQDVVFEAAGSSAQVRAMGHYVTVSWAGATAPVQQKAPDLTTALVALDGLGRVVQSRIVAAT
ncbi:hypothetical protein SAMN05444920_105190 [Nonomuraea solani]|uniref:Uncharacterized protein n=1 Tax=Nonomuraea solani TaxID=1144553 RepID=A0A1H6DDI1_9ACTN|nr:hypothetical protein [Nonomuraea solani]SEG83388.1 hypothetical protein SAMN05444920_105190 [Nonomuraea solani]